MQREIEVKVLNIVPEEIEEKLISLGAEKICKEMQTNYTFEPEDGEFEKGYLRIRESLVDDKRNPIELTFKEVKGDEDVRINNEFTVHIDSVSMMTSGYCGTLVTPMAANFNTLPVALLEMKDQMGVIKQQAPIAVILLIVQIGLMYFLAF